MRKDARFIGKNGSCGLEHGKVYRIEITEPEKKYWGNPNPSFRVFVNNLGIPYDTMNAIKKNWKFLYE